MSGLLQAEPWKEPQPPMSNDTAPPQHTLNCTIIPVYDHRFVVALTTAVVITSLLSTLGSGLIIFTYAAFKNLRTIAREVLVQLSIADIIISLSHIVGIVVNFPRYIPETSCDSHTDQDNLTFATDSTVACKIQGGATMFGTISSFLWTIAVAVYLLTIIVYERQRCARWLRLSFYPICWGIPFTLVLWFAVDDYLGFEESIDIGWCYVKWVNGSRHGASDGKRNVVPQVLGYELWLYLTFLVLPILYIWIRCYIRAKISRVHNKSAKLHAKAKMADFKLTFVPLIFLLLRMWTLFLAIPHCYLSLSDRKAFRRTSYNAVFVLLSGIGSSAQGLMNSILFCACTPIVRKHLRDFFKNTLCSLCRKKPPKFYALKDSRPVSSRDIEATTDSDEDNEVRGEFRSLLVNTDPSDSHPKTRPLREGPVTFNYQAIVTVHNE